MATEKEQAFIDMAADAEATLVAAAIDPKTTDVTKEMSDFKVATVELVATKLAEGIEYQLGLLEVWAAQEEAKGADMTFVRDRIGAIRGAGKA